MITLPELLLHDLRAVPGFDEASFIDAHSRPPETSVRINPAKPAAVFENAASVPWCPGGRYLPERPVFTLDPLFHAGAYYVQEASSMFLHHLLSSIWPDTKGLRVLDLCAAPGGKSTLLASMLDDDSLLIANEVIRTRAPVLEENLVRWGHMNTWLTSNDPRDMGRMQGCFDVIVVDAPCSGSGLFRKDERALHNWTEANVRLCSQRQQRILADIWPALKPDGLLVYATCSYSQAENEDVLDWLAATYETEAITLPPLPEWGIVTANTRSGMAGYRFFPGQVKGEGFFIAAVRKKADTGALRPVKFKTAHDRKIQQQAGYLLRDAEDKCFLRIDKENCNAIHPAHEADWHLLRQYAYLRKTGLNLGSPAGKEWLPAHEAALSVDASTTLPALAVTKEQALRYLKREDLGIATPEKGWHVIQYNGLSLGWIKSLGNRVNNYLPKQWRIRMEIE